VSSNGWTLLVVLTTAGTAQAQARPNLLVLDLEARGASAPETQAATSSVVRGLRQLDVFQVLSSDDVRQLLALERTRQLSGAKAESSIGQMGAALNAPNAVVGSVTKLAGKLQVEIRLLDAPTQQVLNQKTLGPVTVDEMASKLPGLAEELMAPLLREQQGFLVVNSREEAAEILVDDTLVGSVPLKQPIPLARGTHRLTLRKDGFIAQTRSVRINPKETTVEEVQLTPSADYAKAYQEKNSKARVGAYVATGVAVVGIATAITMQVLASSQYNDEFKPRQAWLQGAAGTGPQTKPPDIASNPKASAAWDSCAMSSVAACTAAAQDAKSGVETKQWVAIGAGVVGVAAAGVATWLWLTSKDPNRYADVVAGVGVSPRGTAMVAFAGKF